MCVCVCVVGRVVSHHQAILWHQLAVLQFNSIWHYLSGDSIRSYRLRAQSLHDWSFPPPQRPITSPGCHLCFWPTGYRLEVHMTSSFSLINLLEPLTELRETFYLLKHWFITKEYNSYTARWKRFIRQGKGKGCGASMPSPSMPLSPDLHLFTNPEALGIPSFWVFMEASLYRHDWLSHWLLAIDSTPSLSPLLRGQGEGNESSNPLITQLVLLANSPPP